jgi:uncharacterized protein
VELDLKALEGIVKGKMLALEGTAHSYAHVGQVKDIASILALEEEADTELVRVAALLHDVGYAVGEPHNEAGAELASNILEQLTHWPKERIEKIATIVLRHPIAFRGKLETLEEKIVWDADKIDLLGVIGIARVFHWLGRKPFDAVADTCLKELKPIYDLLNTSSAREIARERHQRTIASLSALSAELTAKDLRISRDCKRRLHNQKSF